MKMPRIGLIAITLLTAILTGCVSYPNYSLLNKLSVGMNKQEAVRILGEPSSSAAQGNSEYLRYTMADYGLGNFKRCFVRIQNGKVESFGEVGDFDSTKDPTIKVKVQ
jgi:SmpA / OmlA family